MCVKVFTSLKPRNDIFINEGGEIAWAIRKNSPLLAGELNAFFEQNRVGTSFRNNLRKRYFADDKMLRRAHAPEDTCNVSTSWSHSSAVTARNTTSIPDDRGVGLPGIPSQPGRPQQWGAVGIMQMPTVRDKAVAISGIEKSAERNIEAGNKYLRYLITTYINDPGIDAKNQTLFAFAAYTRRSPVQSWVNVHDRSGRVGETMLQRQYGFRKLRQQDYSLAESNLGVLYRDGRRRTTGPSCGGNVVSESRRPRRRRRAVLARGRIREGRWRIAELC